MVLGDVARTLARGRAGVNARAARDSHRLASSWVQAVLAVVRGIAASVLWGIKLQRYGVRDGISH